MDPRVLEVQTWVNANYFAVPGYSLAPVTGKTGWSTMYSLTMALQHELGISPVIESFGPSTMAAYKAFGELSQGNVPNNQKGERIVKIIQGACWCKGYNPGGFDGTFGPGTEGAISNLQRDANLPVTNGKVYDYIFKALLSMDAYILTPGGDPKIQSMQRELNYNYFRTAGVQPADGHYQRGTNKALIYGIQTEQGIPAAQQTGSVGPTTKDRLPLLSYGRTGVFVKFLQYALYVNNYDPGAFDGSFGLGVQNTVKEFQRFVGLTPDGYAGKQTWLSALISTGDSSRKGTACDCITKITPLRARTLVDEGYETVGRYLVNVSGGINKKIQPGELQNIFDAGLKVFPIYQLVGLSAENFSYSIGSTQAQDAYYAAKQYGFKAGTTIYFAVDFDALDGEVSNNIIPYFRGINERMSSLGGDYNIGVYGARNVCIRVSNSGYAKTSFVSGMSTGFSGNLGYPLPSNWAFDQISTISIGSGLGSISIDNNIKSGKYNGESSANIVERGLNDLLYDQLTKIYLGAEDFKNYYTVDANVNTLVTDYYRNGRYEGVFWNLVSGPVNSDFVTFFDGKYGWRSILEPIDPSSMEKIDIQHLMATLSGLIYGHLYVDIITSIEDFAGWAGDLLSASIDVMKAKDNGKYVGTNVEKTYDAAYDIIASKVIDSHFTFGDLLSDIDAVNISRIMESRDYNYPIYEAFEEYYSKGYTSRFNTFFNIKYGSNEETLRAAARDIMTDNDNPVILAGREAMAYILEMPDYSIEEGNAIADAYADIFMELVRNEINM